MRNINGRVVSIPLTDMRNINGRVVSEALRQLVRGFLLTIICQRLTEMKENGFYVIKDEFFSDMNDPYLKGNKNEKRPHYYCLTDSILNFHWMIPMSSRVEKYQRIIDKRLMNGKTCDILHIAKLDNDRKNAFLIQDIFPITEKYILREYYISETPLTLTSQHEINEIDKRARKVIELLKHGVVFTPTQPNIKLIIEKLNEQKE